MGNGGRYTYEITNASYAREHALHCLSMRPDDFVEYGKLARLDAPNLVKSQIQSDDGFSFVLSYENGQLANALLVVKETEGGGIFSYHGISAPMNGSLSYMYDTMLSGVLDFLSSQGYTEYVQKYVVNQGSGKILRLGAVESTKYNFYFEENPESDFGTLRVDLVNPKGDI